MAINKGGCERRSVERREDNWDEQMAQMIQTVNRICEVIKQHAENERERVGMMQTLADQLKGRED